MVDDSTVSRRILASLLESAGLQVITATGGLEGIDLARDHRPDVIFMDVRMADLDGFSATRRLAADEATKNIPVIAVTASAFGNTKEAAREAGCVEYLPKPVRAEALFAALKTHLGVQFVTEKERRTGRDRRGGVLAASRGAGAAPQGGGGDRRDLRSPHDRQHARLRRSARCRPQPAHQRTGREL